MKDWQEYFKTAIGLSAMSSVWSADHLAKEIAIALQPSLRKRPFLGMSKVSPVLALIAGRQKIPAGVCAENLHGSCGFKRL